jgi:2-methylisocitrate lyase-like PEP mutase family enzyme
MRTAKKLSNLISSGKAVVAPGTYDAISALLTEQAGFPAVYVSGGAIARSYGLPDLNLLSTGDIIGRVASIVDRVSIPVIADADTGYGGPLNVHRTMRQFLAAGAAAVHLEDQEFPKRCGHYDDKSIVSCAEMVQRIKAARDAVSPEELLIIARTDAIAVEGLDAALDRMSRYMEAGADIAFVEAPETVEQIELIARRLPQPKLINMFAGGKTPMMPTGNLEKLGYTIVIIPSDLQRASIAAMQKALQAIARDGSTASLAKEMVSFAQREEIVGTRAFLERDRSYATSLA